MHRGRRALFALVANGAVLRHGRAAFAADNIAELVTQLKYGDSYKIRIHAAVLLAKTEDARALPALAFAAARDAEEAVRILAVQLLARNPGGEPSGEAARQAIARVLQDPAPRVRASAVEAMAKLKSEQAALHTSAIAAQPARGPVGILRIAVGKMGGYAPDPVREFMRRELVSSLSGVRVSAGRIEVTEAPGLSVAYVVDGTIKRLNVFARSGDVQADCAVDLVLSQPPRGILMVASGEAQVQRPQRHAQGGLRTQMVEEAVSHAVRTAQENIEAFLARRA